MGAKDEDIPRLESTPPEGEAEEVTRVGRPDEIRRALEVEGKDASHVAPKSQNALPTPPAPPPSAEMKKAVTAAGAAEVRLAPPPSDLLAADRGRGNETPTKPPSAGVGDGVDADSAFSDNPFEEMPKSSEHLDSAFLEPAPPSAKALAPPLPPAARRSGAPTAPPAASDTTSDAPPSTGARAEAASVRAPLASRPSTAPAPRSALLVLVVVVAVVAAFALAAMLSGR